MQFSPTRPGRLQRGRSEASPTLVAPSIAAQRDRVCCWQTAACTARMREQLAHGGLSSANHGDLRAAVSTPSLLACSSAGWGALPNPSLSRRFSQPAVAQTTSTSTLSATTCQEYHEEQSFKAFVMLPLDTVNNDGVFRFAAVPWFSQALQLLVASGTYGVALDVWWGAVEKEPRQYVWSGYKQVIELLKQAGLKVQVVLSFHACGGNVGDTAQIPLPEWVLQCGESDPDIFYTDQPRNGGLGHRNREYVSIWADEAAGVLRGRSPVQCYEDFMTAFRDAFLQDLGTTIEEVVVGTGPCGELRLPSYVEANGWRFPGAGEFQCYDRRALASLAQAAKEAGHAEWGYGGPHDAGSYNSTPEHTGFFRHNGSWESPYGRFFLEWYSSCLLRHGERLLSLANSVFAAKLASHPAGQQQGPLSGSSLLLPLPQQPPTPGSAPASCRMSCQSSQTLDRILETATYDLAATGLRRWPSPGAAGSNSMGGGPSSGSSSLFGGPASGTWSNVPRWPPGVAAGGVAASGGPGASPAGSLGLAVGGAAAMAVTAVGASLVRPESSLDPASGDIRDIMDVEASDASATSAGMEVVPVRPSSTDARPLSGSSLLGTGTATPVAAAKFRLSASALAGNADPVDQSPTDSGPLLQSGSLSGPAAAIGVPMAPGSAAVAAVVRQHHGVALLASGPGSSCCGTGSAASTAAARMEHMCNSRSSLSNDYALGANGALPYLDVVALVADGDDMSEVCTSYMGGLEEVMCDDLFLPLGTRNSAPCSDFGGPAGPGSTVGPSSGSDGDMPATAAAAAAGGQQQQQQVLQQQQQQLHAFQQRRSPDVSMSGGASAHGSGEHSLAAAAATAAAAAGSSGSRLAGPAGASAAGPAGSAAATAMQPPISPVLRPDLAYTPAPPRQPGSLCLALKIAGIHWWYGSRSHAAELTAGYYNTDQRDGYAAVVDMCARHRVNLVLTCVEMSDSQHPSYAQCGPEGLLRQLRTLAARAGVALSGENALPIFCGDSVNAYALDRIVANSRPVWGPRRESPLALSGPQRARLEAAAQLQYVSLQRLSVAQAYTNLQQQHGGGFGEDGSLGQQQQQQLSVGNNIVSIGSTARLSDAGRQLSGTHALSYSHVPSAPPTPAVASQAALQLCQAPSGCSDLPSPVATAHQQQQPHSLLAQQLLPSSGGGAGGAQQNLRPGSSSFAGLSLGSGGSTSPSEPVELLPALRAFTFLRLGPELLLPHHQGTWMRFMSKLHQVGAAPH